MREENDGGWGGGGTTGSRGSYFVIYQMVGIFMN